MDAPLLAAAFLLGFAAKRVGLPPLVGYLVAGFVLNAFGYEVTEAIEVVAELGILLLLFGIGLKLRPKTLARPSVWASATVFAAIATGIVGALLLAIGALGIPLARDLDPTTAVLVGFALSFSSTVFAVQALERTNEADSLAGRTAIGVLILQDIFAVAFLVLVEGKWPSPWAILVIPAFLLLRPVAGWFLDRSGHREVLVLCDLEERADSEVAELLGIPRNTVKSRLRRARAALRDQVDDLRTIPLPATDGT